MRLIDADALMETIKAHDYLLVSYMNSRDAGMFTLGIQQAVDEQNTLTLDDLGIVRCNDCEYFDDVGYENPDYEMPELRMGFCKVWRRDTQACRFCSMGERNHEPKE